MPMMRIFPFLSGSHAQSMERREAVALPNFRAIAAALRLGAV